MIHFPLLSESEQEILSQALCYLYVAELEVYCQLLNMKPNGKKMHMINQIIAFIKTGKVLKSLAFPKASLAQKDGLYSIDPEAKMLKGAYKNDALTRAFFKNYIGSHFHFTVFGLDWIKERWLAGNPPTYAEFAVFWQQEYARRQTEPGPLKPEWAYLNFVQKMTAQNSHLKREQLLELWEIERLKYKKIVADLIDNALRALKKFHIIR